MNATLKRILPLMLAAALLGGCAAQKQPAEPTEPPETAPPHPDGGSLDSRADNHAAHVRYCG